MSEEQLSPEEQAHLAKIMELQDQGYTDEQIESVLSGGDSSLDRIDGAGDDIKYTGTVNFNFDEIKSYSPFEEEAPKPKFFRESHKEPQKPKFVLKSDEKYMLNGQERQLRKMSLRDTIRLASKVPSWAKYLSFNTPQMLVDEFTGQYRVTETILALFERAFGDFDHDNDCPTNFCLSVLDEVCTLLNHPREREKIDADYLLDCDPDEVFDAVAQLIEFNKGFFTKAWNHAGPIKSVTSLISGMISSRIKNISALQSLDSLEMSQTLSEE